MQSASSAQRLEEKFGEVGEAVRVNANLSDHLAEIFSIIFKDPQHFTHCCRCHDVALYIAPL